MTDPHHRGHTARAPLPRRGILLLAVLLAAAAGCQHARPAPPGAPAGVAVPPASVALPQATASPEEHVPSALDDMRDPRLPRPLLDPDLIVSGGPPPDGIPALYAPRFQRARDVTWLADTEPVLTLTLGGETRGYPIQVMTWHEIADDTVAGIPVAVTYCPLCNSGVAFDRRAAGRTLTFGTSGRLYADNLVMYDRQTRSLWPQLTGQAAVGVLTGTTLTAYPIGAVAWRDFRTTHPDTWVLSRDTGYNRPYGDNPYPDYDNPRDPPPFDLPGTDGRLPPKERVVGIRDGTESVAIPRTALARDRVRAITLDGHRLTVWHRPGQASALDADTIAGGQDIGTVAVYQATLDGRLLHFTADADRFTDAETRTRWTVLGHATSGPLAGRQLPAYPFVDTFWFAWVAFQPHTRII
jgi:hypothetical protein